MDSGLYLWLILLKAHAALRSHAEAQVRSVGLGLSDFAVLEVLLHKGPTPVNTIGHLVRLTSGSITAAVDRLERQRLVQRCSHATDRRARVVHLTAEGRRAAESAFAGHAAAMERATAGLSPEEHRQAAALLKKLGLYAAALAPSTPTTGGSAPDPLTPAPEPSTHTTGRISTPDPITPAPAPSLKSSTPTTGGSAPDPLTPASAAGVIASEE